MKLERLIWQCRRPSFNERWPSKKLLLGHRGVRAMAPENTLASFELALRLGADGIEFDVWMNKDGIPVVVHDETPDLPALPTLEQTMSNLPDGVVANVELKGSCSYSKIEFMSCVDQILSEHRSRLTIIISSFDTELLAMYRKQFPQDLIALLVDSCDEMDFQNLASIRPDALHLSTQLATWPIIWLSHYFHLKIGVWTVDTATHASKWFKRGVDGVFVDAI